MNTETEETFHGGTHQVRRVGDTVIRPVGAHSQTIHRLLRHLRSEGFTAGPEALSLDLDAGTQTVSFLEGRITNYPVIAEFKTDTVLSGAARLLRGYHDATVGFVHDPTDRWFLPPENPAEVIIHGDFAPHNCVVQTGVAGDATQQGEGVSGVFDFDTARPGPRLWDLGYGAYRWCPLTGVNGGLDHGATVAEQHRRLQLFCDAYERTEGTGTPIDRLDLREVLDLAIHTLDQLVATMHRLASAGDPAFARHVAEGHDSLYLNDIRYMRQNRADLAGGG